MADGGSQQSTTSVGPPAYAQPYITGNPKKGIPGVLPEAAAWYQSSTPSYYPNSTVAGFTPAQLAAQQATLNAATNNLAPNDLSAAGGNALLSTVRGDYVNAGNPYLGAVTDSVMSQVLPAVKGQAELAGRFGSGAEAQALTTAATNALAPYAFNTYNQERSNQLNAANAINPYLSGQQAMQYGNIGQIAGVGGQQQAMNQADISAAIQKFNFEQNTPLMKLQNYAQLAYGAPGRVESMSTPTPSPWQTALGAGLGIGGSMFGAPTTGGGSLGSSVFGK
jgi:hypothetical protein